MKRIIPLFLILILLSIQSQSFSATIDSLEQESQYEERMARLTTLLRERNRLFNSLFRSEVPTIREIEAELSLIVTEPLLKSDIEVFEAIIEMPASYEKIRDVEIIKAELLKHSATVETWEVVVRWQIEGYEGITGEDVGYYVEMEKIDGCWLLKDYYTS
ncbi:hypothetical protein [Alkaliphilus crotonatoxidans]